MMSVVLSFSGGPTIPENGIVAAVLHTEWGILIGHPIGLEAMCAIIDTYKPFIGEDGLMHPGIGRFYSYVSVTGQGQIATGYTAIVSKAKVGEWEQFVLDKVRAGSDYFLRRGGWMRHPFGGMSSDALFGSLERFYLLASDGDRPKPPEHVPRSLADATRCAIMIRECFNDEFFRLVLKDCADSYERRLKSGEDRDSLLPEAVCISRLAAGLVMPEGEVWLEVLKLSIRCADVDFRRPWDEVWRDVEERAATVRWSWDEQKA